MGKKCIGIDIGGTTVKLGLFTVDGELLDKWEVDEEGRRRQVYFGGCSRFD